MTGGINLSGSYVANGLTLGGTGDVYTATWYNDTGKSISVTISVSAKRVPIVNDIWGVRASVNSPGEDGYTGVVLFFPAESEYYYTSKSITVTVPNGKQLFIWNENDTYSIWTITYN